MIRTLNGMKKTQHKKVLRMTFEENAMTDLNESIQDKVTQLLISEHDHLPEEAQEAVEESIRVEPDLWHENADSAEIAKYLASDETDD